MKTRSKRRNPAPLASEFLKGLVATGLLTAIQDQPDPEVRIRRTLRRALQGGCALTAGALAARAWQDGRPLDALTGLGFGIASVMAAEYGMPDKVRTEDDSTIHPLSSLSLETLQDGQEKI